jgi:hypothetical protein
MAPRLSSTVEARVPLDILLFALGLVLAAMTLRDVFDTVVVPGGSTATLRVAHRLVVMFLPMWKLIRGRRRGLSSNFAPFVLVFSFFVWMSLLALAFGLMTYAARLQFRPPVASFADSVYQAGSALVTVGLSPHFPSGLGRWIILGAGFCGLAVMTMAVTYLLEVQQSIARRDTGIIKLNTSAGDPPSALSLLERFATIGNKHELADVIQEGRNWSATVRQSHAAHPSLIYFQSIGTGAGWPAALGALLDLALLMEGCIDDQPLFGPSVLLGDEGARMARQLAAVIGLKPQELRPNVAELRDAAQRLERSGYVVRPDADFEAMARRRADYQSCVNALAEHLGKPTAVLIRPS